LHDGLAGRGHLREHEEVEIILDAIAARRQKMGRTLTILDFGCGNATGVGQFVIPGAGRYVGVDMHDASLAYARQNYGAPNAEFVSSVPTAVTFDVIIYSDLLEHVHDPLGIIRGHLPQLAQDGIMIGSVPNGYGPCEIEKYLDYYLGIYKILRAVKTVRALSRRQAAERAAADPLQPRVRPRHLVHHAKPPPHGRGCRA